MTANTDSASLDALLVDRWRAGDQTAFRAIVDRYRDRIFARVYSMLKNREDAEEVTQDAFIRAHRGLAQFRGEASFSTWLHQIATNLARNRYWYWWRRKRDVSMSLEAELSPGAEISLIDVLPASDRDPSEEAIIAELSDRVAVCLPEMNPKHRQILDLRLNQNLSYEEIAERLQISVGTVKSRLARARDGLREKMGSEFA